MGFRISACKFRMSIIYKEDKCQMNYWTGVLTNVEINLARYLFYFLDHYFYHYIVPLAISLVVFYV